MFDLVKMAFAKLLGRTPMLVQQTMAIHNRVVNSARLTTVRYPPAPRGTSSFLEGWAARLIPTRRMDRSRMHWGPNGAQAMARRVRHQRGSGSDSASLLWVDSRARRWHLDSHGYPWGFHWDSSNDYQTV